MAYRRAVIPALVGGVLLTVLLWWAGASAQALHLQGTADVIGGRAAADLQQWLTPWSYDPPDSVRFGAGVSGGTGETSTSSSGLQLLQPPQLPGPVRLLRRVGGSLITGNEDGAKHCAMNVRYASSTSATPS